MRRWITRLVDRLRYGKIYQPTDWQREPEEPFIAPGPSLPEIWHVDCLPGEWGRRFYQLRPDLYKPPRRVEFFTESDWLRIQAEDAAFALSELDTRKVTGEQTAKYEALPPWMK